MSKQTEILLESGTNELQILEFTIDGQLFGINVAKVREIMQCTAVNPMQNSHRDIEGIFKPRDEVITVINLARHLNLNPSDDAAHDIFIITNFSKESYAFHVHRVVGIARISWANLQKPDEIIYGGQDGVATAIAEYDGRLITILDFEKIIQEINPDSGINAKDIEQLGEHRQANHSPVMLCEDSPLLSRLVYSSLQKAGYTNVIRMRNGKEAWDYLRAIPGDGNVRARVSCIITDIEMPLMDGHHLIKLIRDDARLKTIPIVIFSSLINEQLIRVSKELGADGQFAKPEIINLIKFVDQLTAN